MILEVRDLVKHFPVRRSLADLFRGVRKQVHAIDGASFGVEKGETFGIVGESGCGKTTTGKVITDLIKKTSGTIVLDGKDTTIAEEYKRKVQMIFQDPYSSLNPRFKVRDVLEEPLIIQKIGHNRSERRDRMVKALHDVKLEPPEEFLTRYPHMLSGGQRQRVSIARTLVLDPKLIVADEPVSMIDLSTRAEILHLMKDIKKKRDLTYIYITHDLSTGRYFTDRMAVMYLGKIVEIGSADDIIERPGHPYTKALIAAVPEMRSGRENEIKDLPIKGEISSAIDLPKGCRFNPRCLYAFDRCREEEPDLRDLGHGHSAACWLA